MNIYMKPIKRTVRSGTWETNSSSTHALCIRKSLPEKLPSEVFFGLGEFGWEQETWNDYSTKATYLHTAIYDLCYEDRTLYNTYKQEISEILNGYGIKAEWKEVTSMSDYDYNIDHSGELEEFVAELLKNPELLIEWLFNPESLLVTDNDNSDMELYKQAYNKCANDNGWYFFGKGN